jgi:hypothetical protein
MSPGHSEPDALRRASVRPRQAAARFVVPEKHKEHKRKVALGAGTRTRMRSGRFSSIRRTHNFAVQGYRRSPIYPDFVVQEGKDERPVMSVLVLESKGEAPQG